jgi:histone acetyltransferase (RNA polymerase elongator complex component)
MCIIAPLFFALISSPLLESKKKTREKLQHLSNELKKNKQTTTTSNLKSQTQRLMIKKASKSLSGVLVVTVLTSPYPEVDGKQQKFSCEWDCFYCPNEPGQPRSYLHDEPSVLRANRNKFDPVLQFTDRCVTLAMNGHPVDKIELLILGGTWTSYPHKYQESFIRDLFFAANTFFDRPSEKRMPVSLTEEKKINETSRVKKNKNLGVCHAYLVYVG